MLERDFRALQDVIRRTRNGLSQTEENEYKRKCLDEADRLIDDVIRDLRTEKDRSLIHSEVYRIMVLAAQGGAFGQPSGP